MRCIRLFPVFFSFLLIAAHFSRSGLIAPAILSLTAPGLLLIARPWAARLIQVLLLTATLEWLRTLCHLVQLRQDLGLPWVRLAVIIGAVAAITAASILVFRHPPFRRQYQLP
jgi:hypothetical protein